MSISLYQISVPVFARQLGGLKAVLQLAQTHYAEKKYDETTLLGFRLFPDMLDFTMQVRIATDHAKNCVALLSGTQPVDLGSSEKSLADLIARVDKALAAVNAAKQADIDAAEARTIMVKMRDKEVPFTGLELVQNRSMPNFYFHVTTAYNIVRHMGVEIGKRHFLNNA